MAQMGLSGLPYGDAYVVGTPETDRVRNILFQQQQQRQLLQQRNAMQVDQQIAKDLGNVRGVDTQDILDAYNQHKNYQKQLLFDNKLRNNPVEYNRVKQLADQALVDTYSKINQSQELKQMGKDLNIHYITHPDSYSDDFGDKFSQFQNTPMSKLSNVNGVDLSNPSSFMRQGPDTDFNLLYNEALGPLKVRSFDEVPADAKGLQTKRTDYYYNNSPAQFYQNLLGSLHKHNAGRDAAAFWDHLVATQPEVIQHINDEFNQLTPEDWKRRTGSEKPQIIVPDPNNKADLFAALQAKGYALNNLPQPKQTLLTNQAAMMTARNQQQSSMENTRFQHSKQLEGMRNNDAVSRIKLRQDFAESNENEKQKIVDDNFEQEIYNALQGPVVDVATAKGNGLSGYEVKTSPVIENVFASKDDHGHKILPEKIIVSKAGDTYTGLYTTTDKDGKVVVDETKTKQFPVSSLKPIFRNDLLGKPKTVGHTQGTGKSTGKSSVNIEDFRRKYNY